MTDFVRDGPAGIDVDVGRDVGLVEIENEAHRARLDRDRVGPGPGADRDVIVLAVVDRPAGGEGRDNDQKGIVVEGDADGAERRAAILNGCSVGRGPILGRFRRRRPSRRSAREQPRGIQCRSSSDGDYVAQHINRVVAAERTAGPQHADPSAAHLDIALALHRPEQPAESASTAAQIMKPEERCSRQATRDRRTAEGHGRKVVQFFDEAARRQQLPGTR